MGGRLDFDFDVAEIAHRNEGSMLSSLDATRGASMKRALLATAALGTVFIGNSSSGADLGARFGAPPVAPAPLFTWTGCYIGGHLGGGWGEKTVSVPTLAPGVSVTGDTSGFLGGGQVGCNLQFGSNWVIGIEGDGSGSDIRGDITQTVLGITGTAHAQTDWIASATGRLGWARDVGCYMPRAERRGQATNIQHSFLYSTSNWKRARPERAGPSVAASNGRSGAIGRPRLNTITTTLVRAR